MLVSLSCSLVFLIHAHRLRRTPSRPFFIFCAWYAIFMTEAVVFVDPTQPMMNSAKCSPVKNGTIDAGGVYSIELIQPPGAARNARSASTQVFLRGRCRKWVLLVRCR